MNVFAPRTIAYVSAMLVLSAPLACRSESNPPTAEPEPAPVAATPVPEETAAVESTEPEASGQSSTLAEVVAGEHRSAKNKARDGYRHPEQTLAFLGVEPDDTVVELWPGSGWYTEILAPYVRDEGQLIVTGFDPEGPEAYYGTRLTKSMLERFAREPELFDQVEMVTVPAKVEVDAKGKVQSVDVQPFSLGEANSVDVVLTFRNSHGWFEDGKQDMIYAEAFRVLKPGGVFGVVQHRAAAGSVPEETAPKGYLPESAVIAAAEKAGFELAEKSEVNANPKDTRDYPQGVWTLPPRLALEDKDRDRYLAIGESDRMTLKFVKP